MVRILEGLIGAVFGAILSMVIFYFIEEINWNFAYLIMGICFILGATLGETFLEWIRNVLKWIW